MPFPLAHPAATLPFRRWCPKYLDFPALIVGSVTPDLATGIDDWEYFSHTIFGTFVFCLPVGLLTLWIFHRVRTRLVSTFPNPHRDALLPLCAGAPNSLFRVVISLLLGSWLHIAWDLFTHDHSWVVRHIALFSVRLAGVPLNHLLWLLSSLAGSALLFVMYLFLLHKGSSRIWVFSALERRAYALWCGILLLPFAGAVPLALHEARPGSSAGSLLRLLAMYYLGCAYLTVALVGLIAKSRAPAENC
jgi:hypothetical protein